MKNGSTHAKLLVVAIIWGVSWVSGRVVAADVPPFTAGWIRYIIAVAFFLVFLRLTGRWVIPAKVHWKLICWIGFLSTFIYQFFFIYGMKYTAAGDASLVITFNPIITALLAIPFLGEKMDKRLGIGLVFALSGVIVLFLYSPNIQIPFEQRIWGNTMIALSAISWAGASILMKKAMSHPTDPLSPLNLTVWASFVGLLIQTPAALWEMWHLGFSNPSTDAWYGIVFLAILSTVLSYVWFANGIKVIGAPRAALYIYLVPIFGIVSGWLMIDEQLSFSLLVSFALIVGGVSYAQSKESS